MKPLPKRGATQRRIDLKDKGRQPTKRKSTRNSPPTTRHPKVVEAGEEEGMGAEKAQIDAVRRETKMLLGSPQYHHPHRPQKEANREKERTENRAKARVEPGVTAGPTSRNCQPPREQFPPHRHRGAMSSPHLAWTTVHRLATGKNPTCHVPLHP